MTATHWPPRQYDDDPPELALGWMDRGLCAETDPEAFFPEKSRSPRPAKKVCRSCEVRSECLEYAVDNGIEFGVWGGLTEMERRGVRRQGRRFDVAA